MHPARRCTGHWAANLLTVRHPRLNIVDLTNSRRVSRLARSVHWLHDARKASCR
jgi:hypothetical protein